MEAQVEDPSEEIKRLQRCINDLISVLALPATWIGSEPSQIVQTLLDVLLRMLSLDFAYAKLNDAFGAPAESLRIAEYGKIKLPPPDLRKIIRDSLAARVQGSSERIRNRLGLEEISILAVPLGVQGEVGLVILGCGQAGFPSETENLLLSVAANQTSIGLHEARFRSQQKCIAEELDQRVAQRTAELAAANAELQLQVGLLQHLPVSAWTLEPDGTPDFVNQVWLEYSGQTLDFIQSHPEAWMTAIHPEDREAASRAFWDGVRSGQDFAFETRSLRAQDGTYRWHLQQAVVLRDAEGKVIKFVGTTTDIDDQKRAQEELRTSEGKLQRVIDTIPTLAWCNLPDGSNEFLSSSWHEYTGLSPEEAHGWGWSAAFHPDDLPPLMERWQKMLVSGESDEIEARLRRHDGVYRWFLIRAQAFRDGSGEIVKWYGTSTDIEDRKRAEEALRASETNLRQIVDCVPGLVCTMDASGEIEQLNRPLLEYFGKTPEELKAWKMTDAVHPDDLPEVVKAFTNSVTTGTAYDVEHRCRRADGVYRWFQVRGLPARDGNGVITGWYFLLYDIDDRKHAEEALRASELDARSLLDNMPGLLARFSPDGVPEIFNRTILEYFGKTAEELNEWRMNDTIHPEDLAQTVEAFGKAMASGQPFDFQYRLRRFDGVYRWFQARGIPVRNLEGRIHHWNSLVTDIEDRKRAEEELRNAQSELARVMQIMMMGQLTASIAHEVNQPLSGIITNASTCLRMLDATPPNLEGARETARRTIRDGHRASDVITRLRTLYSKKEPALESMDLNEAAREVTALSATEIQRNGVNLRQEFADDLPPARGDRIQLQQVMLNLLRNAADAMSEVDDRPRELLIRTERDEDNQVRLSVKDSGIGFTPQAANKIFEAFYTTKTDGMGIGLSVSRSIIEAHQGRLWATQNDGPGTTFSFAIPCTPDGFVDSGTRVNQADPSTEAA
jgi:PAS domain S-box-containing protein